MMQSLPITRIIIEGLGDDATTKILAYFGETSCEDASVESGPGASEVVLCSGTLYAVSSRAPYGYVWTSLNSVACSEEVGAGMVCVRSGT